jgi:DNA-binding transcriptional regulator GbsR (MarR family)
MKSNIKEEFIQRVAEISNSWGFKEGDGKIYGILLLSEKPMSMKEISEESGYSISAISTFLDALKRFGLISKVKRNRTYFFKADKDFLRFYKGSFSDTLKREISPLKNKLETEIKRLETRKGDDSFLKMLKELHESVERVEAYLKKVLR